MKYTLSVILLFIMGSSIAQAQETDCRSCSCMINRFYHKIINSDKLPYKKGDKTISMSLVSSSTVSDSSEIQTYFNKITNTQNWYYVPNQWKEGPNTYLTLKQGENIWTSKNQQWFSFIKNKVRRALTIGSTVLRLQVKTKNGKTYTDYFVCNPKSEDNPKLTYDNIFCNIIYMKIKSGIVKPRND